MLFKFATNIKEGQILTAAAKMVAITTLVVPILAGVGYLVTKAMIFYLESRFSYLQKKITKEISQSNLRFYCLYSVVNSKINSDVDKGIFREAFNKLDQTSREKMFVDMANNSCLDHVARLFDPNITKVDVTIGKASYDEIKRFILTLAKNYKGLSEITFDLSATTTNYHHNTIIEELKGAIGRIRLQKRFECVCTSGKRQFVSLLPLDAITENLNFLIKRDENKNYVRDMVFKFFVASKDWPGEKTWYQIEMFAKDGKFLIRSPGYLREIK